MNFGSDEFYRRLKKELCSENNWEITLELEKEVRTAARPTAWRYFKTREDVEDAVQYAIGKILTVSIHNFLADERMETATESRRVSWLRAVIKNAIIDEVRRLLPEEGMWVEKKPDVPETDSPGEWRIVQPAQKKEEKAPDAAEAKKSDKDGKSFVRFTRLDGSKDDDFSPLDVISDDDGDYLERMHSRQELEKRFRLIFTLDAGVEKLVIAAFCMLLSGYGHSFGDKALNKNVAALLSGRTVEENLRAVKYLIYELDFPADAADPLEARLDEEPGLRGKVMQVETDLVTKYVSDVRARVRKVYSDLAAREDEGCIRTTPRKDDNKVVAFPAAKEEEDHE